MRQDTLVQDGDLEISNLSKGIDMDLYYSKKTSYDEIVADILKHKDYDDSDMYSIVQHYGVLEAVQSEKPFATTWRRVGLFFGGELFLNIGL